MQDETNLIILQNKHICQENMYLSNQIKLPN